MLIKLEIDRLPTYQKIGKAVGSDAPANTIFLV